jgi:hypothetical protein
LNYQQNKLEEKQMNGLGRIGRFQGENRWTFLDGPRRLHEPKISYALIALMDFKEPETAKQNAIYDLGRRMRMQSWLKEKKHGR